MAAFASSIYICFASSWDLCYLCTKNIYMRQTRGDGSNATGSYSKFVLFFSQKPGFVMPWYICFPTILDLCNLFMKSRALTGKHLFASKPGNYTPWCLTEMSSPGGYTSFRRKHNERQKKTASSSSQSSRDGQIQGNGQIDQIGIFGRDWQSLWPKLWVAADLNKWIVRFSALLFITNGRACIFRAVLCWQS